MNRGQQIAGRLSQMRKRQGPKAFGYPVAGSAAAAFYDCTSTSLERLTELDMAGMINAQSIDKRLLDLNPSDFPVRPAEGSTCLYLGSPYYIAKVLAPALAVGVAASLVLEVYRAPLPDSAGNETTAEAIASGIPANAGLRKEYIPPKPPF